MPKQKIIKQHKHRLSTIRSATRFRTFSRQTNFLFPLHYFVRKERHLMMSGSVSLRKSSLSLPPPYCPRVHPHIPRHLLHAQSHMRLDKSPNTFRKPTKHLPILATRVFRHNLFHQLQLSHEFFRVLIHISEAIK